MRSGTVAVLAAVGVAFVALSSGAVAADDVALTVSVVDGDGDPVDGATVEATWGGGEATGTTVSNGRVFIDVPEGEDVELDIDDDRYIRNRPLTVQDADERDVELPVASRGEAVVTVTDAEDAPLSDVTVRLRQDGRTVASGETDDEGEVRTGAVEQGEYRLSAVKPGYFAGQRDLSVGADTETEATVSLESGRVALDVAVVDDHFEEPRALTDARVQIEGGAFDGEVSASDGSASVNVPVNARYTISAQKEGYDPTPRQVSVNEEPRSVTVTAQRTHELVASSSNDRVVVGERTRIEVVNAYDEPVSGATVRLNGDPVGETDDRGELAVGLETVGDATIVADDGRVESESVTVTAIDPDAEPEDGTDDGTDGGANDGPSEAETDDLPGFGVGAAVVALLVALAAVASRR